AHGLQVENGNLGAAGAAHAYVGWGKRRIASGIGSRQWQAIECLGGKAVGCPEGAETTEIVIERPVLLHQDDNVIDPREIFWGRRRRQPLATAKERCGSAHNSKQPRAPR